MSTILVFDLSWIALRMCVNKCQLRQFQIFIRYPAKWGWRLFFIENTSIFFRCLFLPFLPWIVGTFHQIRIICISSACRFPYAPDDEMIIASPHRNSCQQLRWKTSVDLTSRFCTGIVRTAKLVDNGSRITWIAPFAIYIFFNFHGVTLWFL